jgi:hypothetical protein
MIGAIAGCSRLLLCLLSLGATQDSSSTKDDDSAYKWLIVGGGLHGVHIAGRLVAEGKAAPSSSSLAIVDDSPKLLKKWKARAASTRMKFMRSSSSLHLDGDVESLRRFAVSQQHLLMKQTSTTRKKRHRRGPQQNILRDRSLFAGDYDRPSLHLFNMHCDHVIEKYGLDRAHICGRVLQINPRDDSVQVVVTMDVAGKDGVVEENKILSAENLVLALGSDEPNFPSWVEQLPAGTVQHIFDIDNVSIRTDRDNTSLSLPTSQKPRTHAVVGGGISAVHKALDLVAQDADSIVHIISRHPLREQQFDTHQDWMMELQAAERSLGAGGSGFPNCVKEFRHEDSYVKRRTMIRQERTPGTVPPALSRGRGGLNDAIRNGRIQWHVSDIRGISSLSSESSQRIALHLSTGETISIDNLILATGFGKRPPGGHIIEDLARTHNLPRAPCGYPLVDCNLRWHPRIFVSGGLAELELGPSARNIAGARMASERIVLCGTTADMHAVQILQ